MYEGYNGRRLGKFSYENYVMSLCEFVGESYLTSWTIDCDFFLLR